MFNRFFGTAKCLIGLAGQGGKNDNFLVGVPSKFMVVWVVMVVGLVMVGGLGGFAGEKQEVTPKEKAYSRVPNRTHDGKKIKCH